MATEIDGSIFGGVIARMGDLVMDGKRQDAP